MVGVDFVYSFRMKRGFLRKVGFARRFKTPDGTARMVPGVWVLPIPTYFN